MGIVHASSTHRRCGSGGYGRRVTAAKFAVIRNSDGTAPSQGHSATATPRAAIYVKFPLLTLAIGRSR